MEKLSEFLKALTIKASDHVISSSGCTIGAYKSKTEVKIKRHSNGKEYVHKKASENKYNNFKLLYSIGVGVKVYHYKDNEVVMHKVTPLHKATKSDIPLDSTAQLASIQSILILHKLSHCDIKVANVGIDIDKLVLLDADEVTKFGNIRRSATKGENINLSDMAIFERKEYICDATTDEIGFDSVRAFIDKVVLDKTLFATSKVTESYLKFIGQNVDENIDVILILDCTGSMSKWIE